MKLRRNLLSIIILIMVLFVFGWNIQHPSAEATITEYVVTPEDYGAIGNDTIDDTAAIQTAINAVGTAGGGTLYIPPKDYYFSKLTLVDNIKVIGANGSTLTPYIQDNNPHITINSKKNIKFEDVNVVAKPDTSLYTYLSIVNSENITIDNCVFDGGAVFDDVYGQFTPGIGALQGINITGSTNVKALNSTIKNYRTNQGVSFNTSAYVIIKNNIITNTNRAGVSINSGSKKSIVEGNFFSYNVRNFSDDGAIDMYGYTPECEDIIIRDNNITNAGKDVNNNCNIRIKDGFNVQIAGNIMTVDKNLFAVIYLQERTAGSKMHNITIERNAINCNVVCQYLIRTNKSNTPYISNFKVTNNTFKGAVDVGTGIEIRNYIDGFIFSNNQVDMPEMIHNFMFFHNSLEGLKARRNIIIANNDFRTKQKIIYAANSVDCITITGNNFYMNADTAIIEIANDCNNLVLTGNVFQGTHARYSVASVVNKVDANNLLVSL